MSDGLKVLEFVHHGISPETILEGAAEELKRGETRHMMIIALDHEGIPCIFATSMNRMEYATMSLAAQELALAALRGQIVQVPSDPGPEGGPSA